MSRTGVRTWFFCWNQVLREDLACTLDESMRDVHAIRVGHVPAVVDDVGEGEGGGDIFLWFMADGQGRLQVDDETDNYIE